MRWTRLGAGLLSLGVLAACGGGSAAPTSSSGGESLSPRLETAHFRIRAGRASEAQVREIAEALEDSYPRVLGDLEASGVLPVTVQVWQDEATFYAEMQSYFGQRYAATGYVTGRDVIRLLVVPAVTRNAVHEFCHVVSLYVNPSLANNPRWLWETVAVFENRELVDPRTLDYMVRGTYPTLAQLDADPNASRQVYEVGYLIGEFVVTRWGRPSFLELIRSNGDVERVLGLSRGAFEQAWYEFVRARYLSS